jgi:hypothetical protein
MNSYKYILGKTLETRLCGEDAINHKYILDHHYQKFRSPNLHLSVFNQT